jgi:hypothetical protein
MTTRLSQDSTNISKYRSVESNAYKDGEKYAVLASTDSTAGILNTCFDRATTEVQAAVDVWPVNFFK